MSKKQYVVGMILAILSIAIGAMGFVGLLIYIFELVRMFSELVSFSVTIEIIGMIFAAGIAVIGCLYCVRLVRHKTSSLLFEIILLCIYGALFILGFIVMFASLAGFVMVLFFGGCITLCILVLCWHNSGDAPLNSENKRSKNRELSGIDAKILEIKHLRDLYVITDEQAKEAAHKLLEDVMNRQN